MFFFFGMATCKWLWSKHFSPETGGCRSDVSMWRQVKVQGRTSSDHFHTFGFWPDGMRMLGKTFPSSLRHKVEFQLLCPILDEPTCVLFSVSSKCVHSHNTRRSVDSIEMCLCNLSLHGSFILNKLLVLKSHVLHTATVSSMVLELSQLLMLLNIEKQ